MKHLKFFIFLCILTFTISCGQQKRYIQYKVKSGETMSVIADKLDMKTKDLVRLNPDVVNDPKANSFIVVPEKKMNSYKIKIKDEVENTVENDSIISVNVKTEAEILLEKLKEDFVTYEIKKGDTFYSLKKSFDLSRGELLLLNPELKEGLKVGQVLKIKEIPKVIESDGLFYDDYIKAGTNLKVALLLPFKASSYTDSLLEKDAFAKNATLLNIATDFYLGAEIAVDSLRKRGVNIELNVYDTGRRNSLINNIISQEDLNKNDAIIGPLYSDEMETVARNVNKPVVFPVYSSNQSQFSYTNIVKTSPDRNIFRQELETYISENFDEGTIIIVSDEKSNSIQNSRILKASLEARTNVGEVHLLTPSKGFIEKSRFLNIFKPNAKNWVIMTTNNKIVVADAVNSLISLPEETTAKLFSVEKGSAFNNVDNNKLARIGFTYVSDEFVDENSLAARTFTRQYKRKNKALPSFYATKGFDITFDILVRLASGNDLKSTFTQGPSFRVETKFDYTRSINMASNEGLFILQYNKDLTLTRLK